MNDTPDGYMKDIIEALEASWDNEAVEIFKKALFDANKALLDIQTVEKEKYKLLKFQTLESIISEIVNSENNNVYNSDPKLFSDYIKVKGFLFDFVYFLEELFKVISGMKESSQGEIKKLNSDIISLSKKEKNYILGTFIFQFIIFVIIQFFEVSSINFNLINNKRKNAKKIK